MVFSLLYRLTGDGAFSRARGSLCPVFFHAFVFFFPSLRYSKVYPINLLPCGTWSIAPCESRRALKTWEREYGPQHPKLAAFLNNQATLRLAQGESFRPALRGGGVLLLATRLFWLFSLLWFCFVVLILCASRRWLLLLVLLFEWLARAVILQYLCRRRCR